MKEVGQTLRNTSADICVGGYEFLFENIANAIANHTMDDPASLIYLYEIATITAISGIIAVNTHNKLNT